MPAKGPTPADRENERRVKVGNLVVRLVPAPPRHPAHFVYDLLVDDVHRGWLAWRTSSRVRHRSWTIYGHLPPLVHYGTSRAREWREIACNLESWRAATERVPALMADERQHARLHSEAEALEILQEADREKERRTAAWADEQAKKERDRALFDQAQAEALEAMQSIRLWADEGRLSNFEISGLEWLIKNLPRLKRK